MDPFFLGNVEVSNLISSSIVKTIDDDSIRYEINSFRKKFLNITRPVPTEFIVELGNKENDTTVSVKVGLEYSLVKMVDWTIELHKRKPTGLQCLVINIPKNQLEIKREIKI